MIRGDTEATVGPERSADVPIRVKPEEGSTEQVVPFRIQSAGQLVRQSLAVMPEHIPGEQRVEQSCPQARGRRTNRTSTNIGARPGCFMIVY